MIDPHGWMTSDVPSVPAPKKEGIRGWYSRTTGRSRKAIGWATGVSLIAMGVMWCASDIMTLQHIQTFNGALTVPLLGGLWIFAFIFMFLVPSREASFRGQEALEGGVDVIKKLIDEQLGPGINLWFRIGQQVQQELPRIVERSHQLLDQADKTLVELRTAAAKIDEAVKKNDQFVTDVQPAVQALKRIEDQIEAELKNGLLKKVGNAAEAVQQMSGVPGETSLPDLSWAINAVKKSKDGIQAGGRKS